MPPKGPGSSAGKKKQQKDNKRNCKLGETNGMMVIRVENVGWKILNRENHLENISVGKCQKKMYLYLSYDGQTNRQKGRQNFHS